MTKWKFDPVFVERGGYFVFIEDGYISYGDRTSYSSERLAHFLEWYKLDWSYQQYVDWARLFLNGLPELYAIAE